MGGPQEPGSEAWLAALWQARLLPEPLRTTDGRSIAVITPGLPNPDRGPDFRDALLLFDGCVLRCGAVEVHRFARDWEAHGHAADPVYNGVILHLVGEAGPAPHCADGTTVPEVVVPATLVSPQQAPGIRYGYAEARPCRGLRAEGDGAALAVALEEAGQRRFFEKAARFRAELGAATPDHVLYRALMEGLGYARNQDAYRALADRLPWERLAAQARVAPQLSQAWGDALLEAAGLVAEAETRAAWDRFRLLPAAQPEARLRAAGRLLARFPPHGPAQRSAAAVLAGQGRPAHLLDLLTVRAAAGDGGIGRDRAIVLAANGVLPFLWAWAEVEGREDLAAGALYRRLPAAAGGDRIT
ncbi:MAG: DUF2851 family protein, partial [Chloroflexi bacterium]|nr:DUF2851 family protein [Chloroflexota bacterium]